MTKEWKTRKLLEDKLDTYTLETMEKRLDELQDLTVIDTDSLAELPESIQVRYLEEEDMLIAAIGDRKDKLEVEDYVKNAKLRLEIDNLDKLKLRLREIAKEKNELGKYDNIEKMKLIEEEEYIRSLFEE